MKLVDYFITMKKLFENTEIGEQELSAIAQEIANGLQVSVEDGGEFLANIKKKSYMLPWFEDFYEDKYGKPASDNEKSRFWAAYKIAFPKRTIRGKAPTHAEIVR